MLKILVRYCIVEEIWKCYRIAKVLKVPIPGGGGAFF